MADLTTYKDVLYSMKSGFLIIGLTGYTGSGCSTAAKILTNKTKPCLPALEHTETGPDDKRYTKLLRVWEHSKWDPFINIEVSRVIFLMAVLVRFPFAFEMNTVA
jgi:hypothetical protein